MVLAHFSESRLGECAHREEQRTGEAQSVVTRSVEQRPTLRVQYRLTPHGRALGPVIDSLWVWGVVHLARLHDTRVNPRKI